ncbi:MAG: LamG domain-containing protein, partial [Lentisphaeraceae bacterium]|nr:LamG domain-containing protein [Lentisphaeraceae bacterium]
MSFWMTGLLALLPLGFSAQAADVGVTMLHKMDFEAVMVNASNYIAPKDLGSGARAFPMSTNGGITFNATKAAGWNGSGNALGTGSSGIRFRNGNGLGATTGTGWTLSFQAQAAGAPGNPDLGPIGMTLGKVGEGDNLSLHLNVNISNNQGYALVVKRANTTDIATDKAAVTVTEGTNMAPFEKNVWHHYAVRCVPDAGGGQPTFELWQDGERKGAITVAGITDGTWVVKELLIGRTRGNGNLSTPEGGAYQNAPGSRQDLDEVALFDRALSAEGVTWLKDHAAAVPPTELPASVLGAVLGTMNEVNVGNASVTTIKFGSSELALTGPTGVSAIRAGTKLEGVTIFFREGSGANNNNAKYLVLTDTADKVLGVSDAAEPTPWAATKMTVAYTFTEAPTIDGTSAYRIYLTAQENVAVGDTFNTSNAVTARFLALQKAASSADFTFNTAASQYAPAMTFSLRVPRALNVNFTVGDSPLVEGTDYGVAPYPAAQWRNMTTENRGGDTGTITFSEALRDTTGSAITVTATARKLETQTGDSTVYPLFRDTLVDSGEAEDTVKVKISGIPYKLYDVYVYMAANAWDKNGSITLGDDTAHHYYVADGATEASVAETATAWGDARPAAWGTPALGVNVLCLRNLSGDEMKLTTWRREPARGNITAIQVVEVPTNELTVWSATLSADGAVSTVTFTNTRGETKLLSELAADDRAELTVAGAATLTLDAAAAPGQFALLGGGTLTLAGAQTLTTAIEVNEGTLAVAADAAATEGSTIKVASTAVLAPRATLSAQVTGAGSVTIETGQTAALSNAANDFTGGTVVNGTLLWQGVAAYGTGAVTVNAGGVFDLNGLRCAQAVTLNGGTLKGSEVRHALSVNFYPDKGAVAADEVAGLVPMLGEYWSAVAASSTTGTADLKAVQIEKARRSGASVESWSGALAWARNNNYDDVGRNTPTQMTNYLGGYLDDGAVNGGRANVTLTIPEAFAARRYTLYLYSSCDTTNQVFSARDITGDSGTTTSYTYVNGALTQGTTGWGNARTGRTTVAEGTNVMVLPSLTDRVLKVEFMNRSGRGGLAAIQAVFGDVTYSGALTVAADSVIEVPEAGKTLFLTEATVSGSGTLTKQGAGALHLAHCTFGAQPLTVAEGNCVVAEGNTLNDVKLTVAAGAQVAPEAGVSALSVASLAGAGTVELGDLTALTLTGSGAGTVAFEGTFTAATRDATLANAVCALIKQGTNTQVLAQLPTTLTFEVQAQAGMLKVNAATAQTLKRLVTTGGTFATDGVGEISVEFAQMASGAANFASRATAQSARPAMEGAGDATVSKFTLADGGTILYQTRADLAKYFPAGFIPEGDYTVQLGADLYSELSFPYIFTVMGAPATARFTVRSSTGAPAPEGSWSASGNTITLNDSSAITGEVNALGNPKYHYTFDADNLNKADDAEADGSLNNEGASYENSDNGKCLASGTPWSGGFHLPSSAWSFGTYFRLKATQEKNVLFGFGQSGTSGALYLAKGAGNTVTLWHNPTGSGIVELFTVPLKGSGETWNHLLLVHTEGTITCYINGVQQAIAKGDFAKALSQFQIGSMHGGEGQGLTKWSGHDGQVDDLAVWHSALVGQQVTEAAAKVMGKWRWREGETPALALDAAATDWQMVDGTLGAWPGTTDDSDYTAAVSFTTSATLEALFEMTATFPAREVLWDGAAVTFEARETALTLSAGAPRLAVANDLTVDLAGVELALLKAACSTPAQMKLADGVYSGEITLRNVPDGLFVTAVAQADGLYAYISQVPQLTVNAWEWILSVDNRWDGAGSGVLYGLDAIAVYGENWNETHQGPGGASNNPINNPKKQDGTLLNGASVNFTFGGAIGYWSGYSDKVKKGYAPGPTRYAFSGLPAGEYAVVLYAVSSNNVQASPVRVTDVTGNVYYTYRNGALQRSAEVPAVAWGRNNVDGYVVGQNTIVMPATANDGGSIVVEISDADAPTAGPGLDWQTAVGRGYTAGIQLVKMKASEAYARTLTGNDTWNATGAWTKLADSTTVDVPPAGATLFLTVTADATLTMGDERPELANLFVDGAGALTLDYANLSLAAGDYADVPFERTLLTVTAGLPENLTIRTSALNYGAYATVTYTETEVVATVNAPEGLWQESDDALRILSINFADSDAGNSLSGTAQEGLPGYEVHAALW